MPESSALTQLVNSLLQGVEVRLFESLGAGYPKAVSDAAAINSAFAMELLIAGLMVAFFIFVRMTLSVEKPNPAQQLAEMVHEFVGGQAEQIIGDHYKTFQAYITCIGVFILLNNLVGLIPGLKSPTTMIQVTLGLALPTFFYYNYYGVKTQGPIGYLKHFAGPIWWMSWLVFPIECFSHLARILSLSVRLYANMFAGDLVTLVFFSMCPVIVPAVFLVFHFAISFIQAFVFMLLTMIYLSLATAHEH
jgi:F-type H+-transporting ATPase subunit a